MLGKLVLDLALTAVFCHRIIFHNELFLGRVLQHLPIRRLEGSILPGTPLEQHVLFLCGEFRNLHVALASLRGPDTLQLDTVLFKEAFSGILTGEINGILFQVIITDHDGSVLSKETTLLLERGHGVIKFIRRVIVVKVVPLLVHLLPAHLLHQLRNRWPTLILRPELEDAFISLAGRVITKGFSSHSTVVEVK